MRRQGTPPAQLLVRRGELSRCRAGFAARSPPHPAIASRSSHDHLMRRICSQQRIGRRCVRSELTIRSGQKDLAECERSTSAQYAAHQRDFTGVSWDSAKETCLKLHRRHGAVFAAGMRNQRQYHCRIHGTHDCLPAQHAAAVDDVGNNRHRQGHFALRRANNA
jgi:hypothetical protein